jgi:hypothetical protein
MNIFTFTMYFYSEKNNKIAYNFDTLMKITIIHKKLLSFLYFHYNRGCITKKE